MPHDLMEERAARTEPKERVRAAEAACGSTARYRERMGGRSRKSVIFSG